MVHAQDRGLPAGPVRQYSDSLLEADQTLDGKLTSPPGTGIQIMLRILLGLALSSMACLLIWPASFTSGDEGEIQVVQAGAENQYPNSIKFFVTASSVDEIDEIRLFFRTTGRDTPGAYRALDFDADELVTAESFLPTGGGANYIPPGTEITYYFEIRDAAGAVSRTPQQKIIYTDSRFEWETLSSGSIIVYYYWEGGEGHARLAVDAARETIDRMAPVLGFDPSEPIRIVAYHSYSDMFAALPLRSRMLGGVVRTEGIAFGDERVVLIPGFGSSVRAVTSHEITHLAVAEVTGRAHIRVPAWLNEGLAEFGNLEPIDNYEQALRLGILRDRIRPLWTLGTFGSNADDIIVAYGQGQSVVRYLIKTYGEDWVAELMQAIRNTFDIDQALKAVYGFDQYGLDVEWRESLGLEPLPRPERGKFSLVLGPTVTPTFPKPTPTPSPVRSTATPTSPPTPTSRPIPTRVPPTPTSPSSESPTPHTATPEPTPVATVKESDGARSSPGCSGSQPGLSGVTGGDLAMIAILFGPLAMLVFRSRRPF